MTDNDNRNGLFSDRFYTVALLTVIGALVIEFAQGMIF